MEITTERLAYWYFRLNGFLGLENFIVHRHLNNSQHATEIDFLGVRFMHRKELNDVVSNEHMIDDLDSELFKYYPKDKIYICLAEVKRGRPRINSSWLNSKNSLQKLMFALGVINKDYIPKAVEKIQRYGYCKIHRYFISFIAIGNNDFNEINLKIPIIDWYEILSFIYNRFTLHNTVKRDLSEWREFREGEILKDLAVNSNSLDRFIAQITILNAQ